MSSQRKAIPQNIQTKLLYLSRRRCCLCFGLRREIQQKDGQIAHLDKNPKNNSLENLVWLCLPHHDEYDTVRRQTKCLTASEVKAYRNELYEELKALTSVASEDDGQDNDPALEIMHRYSFADDATSKIIIAEIFTRIEQIYQFFRLHDLEQKRLDKMEASGYSEQESDARYQRKMTEIREKLKIPPGVWGLNPEGIIPVDWRTSARQLAQKWVRGRLSYEKCVDVLWIFDELYDFDLHYILFGLPNETLTGIQYGALKAFIFEHGQRAIIR